ncbi:MAG: NAD(P)/FAD-dependent oxidoreductase [Candidatus Diapherotrites archaeon]|nr:NAD(P)/FAD-dependent oxidoreductase [Candidatus Diapherotrites archaeon]
MQGELFDVAVIGAGPAGGSATLHAAKQGLKTVLLEEHAKIGEPVHCGECLSDVAFERFGFKPPKEAVALNVKGVRVVFPNKTYSKLTEPGVVLEKHLFEQWISRMAVDAGAQLELQCRVEELNRQGSEWGLKCSNGRIFRSRAVIDASGVQSIASRKLNLNPRFKAVTGMQYEMLDIPTDGYLDFYLWPKLAPFGYLWMIPKNDGRANVGIIASESPKAKANLDQFIKEMGWESKAKVKAFGGLIPEEGPVKNTYGEALLLVGDAAGFTSPMFEGGTQLGLISGKMAAEVCARAVEQGNFSQEFFSQYERTWKKEFPPYEELLKGKELFYSFSDEELNQIAGLLPKELNNVHLAGNISIAVKILTRYPGLIKKGVVRAFKAFRYSRAQYYGW